MFRKPIKKSASQLWRKFRPDFLTLEERSTPAVIANPDTGLTNENTILSVVDPGATGSLTANDTGSGSLTVVGFSASSAQGAAIVVNPSGTFTYNPTAAANLQALGTGQSVVDTFTYTISDGVSRDSGLRVKVYQPSGGVTTLAGADAFLTAPTNLDFNGMSVGLSVDK